MDITNTIPIEDNEPESDTIPPWRCPVCGMKFADCMCGRGSDENEDTDEEKIDPDLPTGVPGYDCPRPRQPVDPVHVQQAR